MMINGARTLAAACSGLLLLVPSCGSGADGPAPTNVTEGAAEVVAVVDGDTIDVVTDGDRFRVRLLGIDAPEIGHDGSPDECYAQESRDALNALVYGEAVQLVPDATQADVDAYDRVLRHVYIDGDSAAVVLLEAGAAYEYTYADPYDGAGEHQDAEDAARAAEAGLWGVCA